MKMKQINKHGDVPAWLVRVTIAVIAIVIMIGMVYVAIYKNMVANPFS